MRSSGSRGLRSRSADFVVARERKNALRSLLLSSAARKPEPMGRSTVTPTPLRAGLRALGPSTFVVSRWLTRVDGWLAALVSHLETTNARRGCTSPGQDERAWRRRAVRRRALALAPQSSIEHQRRELLRLRSRKSQPQPPSSSGHVFRWSTSRVRHQVDGGVGQPVGDQQRRIIPHVEPVGGGVSAVRVSVARLIAADQCRCSTASAEPAVAPAPASAAISTS